MSGSGHRMRSQCSTTTKSNLVPVDQRSADSKVGYRNPPGHSRFKPGQSGNPSGRSKGSQNLKTLFNQILDEKISLRDGSEIKKVSKAEAVLRAVVLGALKGDPRNLAILLRLAEQAGGFEDDKTEITRIERVIVRWQGPGEVLDPE